ncbi:kinase-like domain-containing protein [Hygrophoropsis aurantiaca]|uniref:Kinase-like domain-containing protein n=1 Tax=Hygrophoropsis aurantiaca TaxID=72124 RepID=A0ACB8ASW5_9AGAM|nr:kinase-like domain-containing protein [Hygrophoropsis aurantiaca]
MITCLFCGKTVQDLNKHNREEHLSASSLIQRQPPKKAARPRAGQNAIETPAFTAPPENSFSQWVQSNPSMQMMQITADDIAEARNPRTDNPNTPTGALRNAMKYLIQDLIDGFSGLSDELNRSACGALVRSAAIYPSLIAYTFTHIKCCLDDSSLLDTLATNVAGWNTQGPLYCLLNYKSIRKTISDMLKQTNVEQHVCNASLIGTHYGARLDTVYIGALMAEVAATPAMAKHMFALRGGEAQAIIDLLQALTDVESPELDQWYKRRYLDALIRLSRKAGLYPESLLLKNVTILGHEPLYSGSFGAVYKGELHGRLAAIKRLKAGSGDLASLLREFAHEAIVWRHIRHPNCLPFYGVYRVDGDNCMVSPWMENASLNIYLVNNPDADRLQLIADIARGLHYLHTSQPTVVHGDLKGPNVLVTSAGRACLADFGLSMTSISQAVLPSSTELKAMGSLNYVAPELLEGDSETLAKLDQRRCDMYSFGCVCYEILVGKAPFQGMDRETIYRQKLVGNAPSRPKDQKYVDHGLDDDMWGFIVKFLHKIPESRATAEQAGKWLGTKTIGPRPADWDTTFLSELTSPAVGYPFTSTI